MLCRFRAEARGSSELSESEVVGNGLEGLVGRGTERMLVKEVKRGRMYENAEADTGASGGGDGGLGGGNHVCNERRARSDVTCRCRYRSAFDPTI